MRGLYRKAGDQAYIDVVRLEGPGSPPCWARFLLDRDLGLGDISWDNPRYVEVIGRPISSRWSSPGLWDFRVARWSVLPLDPPALRAACQQAVAAQSEALQQLDWAALASPAFFTGTVGFRPAAEDLTGTQVLLVGADDQRPLLVLTATGPDLPGVRPMVRRWLTVDCVYDLEQGRVVELMAGIRGELLE